MKMEILSPQVAPNAGFNEPSIGTGGLGVDARAPNSGAAQLLILEWTSIKPATHYCTDCALGLLKAAGGEGKVVILPAQMLHGMLITTGTFPEILKF